MRASFLLELLRKPAHALANSPPSKLDGPACMSEVPVGLPAPAVESGKRTATERAFELIDSDGSSATPHEAENSHP